MSVLKQMWDSMELYMRFMESMSEDNIVCFGWAIGVRRRGQNFALR